MCGRDAAKARRMQWISWEDGPFTMGRPRAFTVQIGADAFPPNGDDQITECASPGALRRRGTGRGSGG
jgi:hypothetical protein